MLITYCIPCQHGQHADHYQVIEAAPEGMMGGAECHCQGECTENYQKPETIIIDNPVEHNQELIRELDKLFGNGTRLDQDPPDPKEH